MIKTSETSFFSDNRFWAADKTLDNNLLLLQSRRISRRLVDDTHSSSTMSRNEPPPAAGPAPKPKTISYIPYNPVLENTYVPSMRRLISQELSEPYSIYVYRYFLYQWGDLCYLAMDRERPYTAAAAADDNDTEKAELQKKDIEVEKEQQQMIGVVVSKLEPHRGGPLRGYIAMLAVQEEYRGEGIATRLVRMTIDKMAERGADEVLPPLISLLYIPPLERERCG